MDVTLIPISESKFDKKHKKTFLTDNGMAQLTDCTLVLLHKSGMHPLYLIQEKNEKIVSEPQQHQVMAKPDLILCCNTETGKQSARVIQEQLERCSCHVRILEADFSVIKKTNQSEQLKNLFSTRASRLEQKGHKHIVVVADSESLGKIAHCMNDKGLNQSYNIPIYSFSDGKEIVDRNLIENLYITREMLDHILINSLNQDKDKKLSHFKGKCRLPIDIPQLQRKLHFPERN